jgi:AmmeMemoRadiSam system protein A
MPYRRLRSRNSSLISLYIAVILAIVCVFTTSQYPIAKEMKAYGAEEKGKEVHMTSPGELTEEEGKHLLSVARKTIEEALSQKKEKEPLDPLDSPKFSEKRGTFVTLTINGSLRGCIGHIIPQESLIDGVKVNAINAAFRDPRFRPLSKNEFEKIKVEISVLTSPKALSYSDANDLLTKLRPGIDGVIIKKGYHQATFLPQVWEQLPDKMSFLTHLCLKAGLDGDTWKNEKLDVSVYQVQAFEE